MLSLTLFQMSRRAEGPLYEIIFSKMFVSSTHKTLWGPRGRRRVLGAGFLVPLPPIGPLQSCFKTLSPSKGSQWCEGLNSLTQSNITVSCPGHGN